MIRGLLANVFGLMFWASAVAFAQAPPSGNNLPVQAVKTGNYTVKSTDLKTVLPFNCAASCIVTLPRSTGGWPKGYPVIIQNVGGASVTVEATSTSTIYGVPLVSGNVILINIGNWASFTADPSNNYLALIGGGAIAAGPQLLQGNGVQLQGDGVNLTGG